MKASNFASKIWVSIKLPDSPWQQHDDHLCCDDVRGAMYPPETVTFLFGKDAEEQRRNQVYEDMLITITHSFISAAQNLTPATGVERKSQSCTALKVLAVICAHNQDENSNQKHDMSYKLLSRQGLNHTTKLPCHPHRNHSWTAALLYAFVTLRFYVMSRHWDEFLSTWFGQMYPVIKLCFTLL